MKSIAEQLKRFRIAQGSHDRENPTHGPATGVCLSWSDLETLGFDDGEELWGGFTIHGDEGCTGNFRIICDKDPLGDKALSREDAKEDLVLVGREMNRDLERREAA